VTVADCERVQTAWFEARATTLGGRVIEDEGLRWIVGPDGVSLMFPAELSVDGLRRGVERARVAGHGIGVWLGLEVDAGPLADAGFECGWAPWWMTAHTQDIGRLDDERIVVQERSDDYSGAHAGYGDALALCRERPQHTWYAAAYDNTRFAGRAWAHLVAAERLAGVFDMDVWPRFQRRGLGTGLLRAVCAEAAAAGATDVVLNATPEGKALYDARGFHQIGEGITWWLHRG
jgi:GNAT superfamily N-acetyltransferase